MNRSGKNKNSSFTDMTHNMKSKISEETFKKAVLGASIVSMTNAQGTITFVNDNFVQISGYSSNELIGQNHRIINSGHHPKSFWVKMWKTISRGDTWREEVKNKAKDGTYYWVDTYVMPMLNEAGELEGFLSIRNDITARKVAEAEVIAANNTLRETLDFAKIGTAALQIATGELKVSKELATVLEVPDPQEFKISLDQFLNTFVPEDDRELLINVIQEVSQNQTNQEQRVTVEFEIKTVTGKTKYIEAIGIFQLDGIAFGILQDVTKRNTLEHERELARIDAITKGRQIERILYSITDGFFALDRNFRFTLVNPSFIELVKMKAEDILGQNLFVLFPHMKDSELTNVYRNALMTGESASYKFENPFDKDQHFDIQIYPSLEGLFVYFRDISEEVYNQKKLQEEETRVLSMAHNLPHVVTYQYVISKEGSGYYSFISKAIERLFGYTVAEILNNATLLDDGIHPDDREEHFNSVSHSIETRSIYKSIYRQKAKDGVYRWVDVRSVPRLDEGGNLIYDGVIVDITEQKKLEQALRDQQMIMQAFYNSTKDISIILNASCCFVSYNEMARENLINVFGVSPPIGTSAIPLFRIFSMYPYIEEALAGKHVLREQKYAIGGETRWYNMQIIPVKDASGSVMNLIINLSDITSIKLAFQGAEKARMDIKAILNASMDATIFLTTDYHIQILNEKTKTEFKRLLGREPAHGDNFLDYVASVPELMDKFKASFEQALLGVPVQKEAQLQLNGQELWIQIDYYPVRNGGEEVVGVSINMKDITARKEAEIKLNKRDNQLRATAVLANIGDWELDLRTMRVFWSHEVCRIHEVEPGYEPDVSTAIDFYTPESREAISKAVQQCIETGRPYDLQLEILTAKGVRKYIRTIGVCERYDDKAIKLYGLFQDLSPQYQAQKELEKLAYIVRHTNNLVVITDAKRKIEWVNKAFEDVTGYKLAEIKGKTPGSFLQGPESDQLVIQNVREALNRKEPVQFQLLNYTKWGVKYWVESRIEPVFNKEGLLTNYMAIQVEITDKKYTDAMLSRQASRLQQANQQLINLSENIPKGAIYQLLVKHTGERIFLFISAGIENIVGVSAHEIMTDSSQLYRHQYKPDESSIREAEKTAVEHLTVFRSEFRLRHRDGHLVWVHASSKPRQVEEGTLFDGFVIDITERKEAEHALFQSKKYFESLVNSQTNYLIRLNTLGYFTFANGRFLTKHNLSYANLVSTMFEDSLLKSDQLSARQVVQNCVLNPGKVFPVTLRSVSPEGATNWTEWEFVAIQNENDEVVNIQGVGLDATDRVQSQQQLQIASSRLMLATKAARLGVGEWNLINQSIHLDDTLKEMLGIYSDEITANEFRQHIHPEDDQTLMGLVQKVSPENPIWEGTFRMLRPLDKKLRIIRFYCIAEFDDKGVANFMTGVNLDITEQELAITAIQESEKRFRALADSSPVLIWMADVEKHMIYFNKRWLNFTGRLFEEEVGEGWLYCIHPEDREEYQHMYTDHFNERHEFLMEFRLRRKDGQYRWMLGHGVPRYLDDGLFVGYIGSCFDIHDRKEAELKLLDRNREKDILIKEIHHRVKNNLQLISSIIFIRLNKMARGEVRTFLEETRNKIHSIALLHEHLLQTEGLNRIDMEHYVTRLLKNLAMVNSLRDRNIELAVSIEPISIDIDVAIHCGLILNELISNSMKHAFNDRAEGKISVSLKRTSDDKSVLRVADNGVGLPPEIPGGDTAFGMQLLEVSFKQLKAHVTVDRIGGTSYTIVF